MIALALAEAGAVICVRRDQNSLIETKASIEALGRTCITGAQDVTNISSIDETLSKFENIAGAVDILVNNAGTNRYLPRSRSMNKLGQDHRHQPQGRVFWSQGAARRMSRQCLLIRIAGRSGSRWTGVREHNLGTLHRMALRHCNN
ncbi:SDR family NAD(P)-dependent oxidoreductase [Rhizobium lentis]|uniref:SDR family NAD(P)-dependent oxidoreductase n=1 Tax=Rhizobium lentis TaxID=1138194 RepID=UPI002180A60A|nr:SDR family NAD(P)-dependent oxidoreductase [Rhizobium lentis]